MSDGSYNSSITGLKLSQVLNPFPLAGALAHAWKQVEVAV